MPSRNQRRTKCLRRGSSVERRSVDRVPTFADLGRGVLAAIALFSMILACRHVPKEEPRARGPAFARGDRVVVEPAGGEFFEGRVLSVSAEGLRVERVGNGETSMVAASDVYRLPVPLAVNERGRLAICALDKAWIGCRIDKSTGTEINVTTLDDRTLTLPRAAVLAPSSVTELNLKQRFERRAARARFAADALDAGEPLAPGDFRPQPNARVVAERQGSWWSAVVLSSDDDSKTPEVAVRFFGDGHEQTLRAERLVPEPVAARLPARGAFVLVRPLSPADPWKRMRVLSAADAEAKVEGEDGSTRTVPARDMLPLGAK